MWHTPWFNWLRIGLGTQHAFHLGNRAGPWQESRGKKCGLTGFRVCIARMIGLHQLLTLANECVIWTAWWGISKEETKQDYKWNTWKLLRPVGSKTGGGLEQWKRNSKPGHLHAHETMEMTHTCATAEVRNELKAEWKIFQGTNKQNQSKSCSARGPK